MKRTGKTEKISISLDRADLAIVRRRAKRVHGGNISRVIADAIQYLRYEEGRDALIASFGDEAALTAEELDAITAEWRGGEGPRPKKRRRAA